jgi:prepilin-type N-terminal cleavage/methylation domain-containing protein
MRFRHSGSAAGFTMVEVLTAVSISLVLALSVTAVVTSTLNVVADTELAATTGARSQKVISQFTSLAREASRIAAVSPTQISFSYRGSGQCELHTYRFEADPNNAGRLQLRHRTAALTVPYGSPCSSVDTKLLSTGAASNGNVVELSDLATTSRFTYFATTGQQALTPGDTGFSTATAIAPCMLGSTSITLGVRAVSRNKTSTATESGQAAFMNNLRGVGCGLT